MSTKIQISEEARAGLNRYASRMKKRLGRRVTFDDVIMDLLEVVERQRTDEDEPQRVKAKGRGL